MFTFNENELDNAKYSLISASNSNVTDIDYEESVRAHIIKESSLEYVGNETSLSKIRKYSISNFTTEAFFN